MRDAADQTTEHPTPARPVPRPGGRSARVQAAVHRATNALLAAHGREALTIPMIATEAGVTPSTLYRRWGDLKALLADAAVEHLRPEAEPDDTGSLHGDLLAWAEAYADEVGSPTGIEILRDVVSAAASAPQQPAAACRCAEFAREALAQLNDRAVARGEAPADLERLMDLLVGPIVYRALMRLMPTPPDHVRSLVALALRP